MFPPERVREMHARLQAVADGLGVPFSPRNHAPSTKPALVVSDYARQQGRLDAWREAAMNAHWRDGEDIEDRGVIARLAAISGLDPNGALAALDDPGAPALLRRQREEAAQWGVTGIPTWFLLPAGWTPGDAIPATGPRAVRVVGAQPMEVVERAARMAGAVERA